MAEVILVMRVRVVQTAQVYISYTLMSCNHIGSLHKKDNLFELDQTNYPNGILTD